MLLQRWGQEQRPPKATFSLPKVTAGLPSSGLVPQLDANPEENGLLRASLKPSKAAASNHTRVLLKTVILNMPCPSAYWCFQSSFHSQISSFACILD